MREERGKRKLQENRLLPTINQLQLETRKVGGLVCRREPSFCDRHESLAFYRMYNHTAQDKKDLRVHSITWKEGEGLLFQ